MSDNAAKLIAAARELKGIPWRHQGLTRKGIDCIGLLVLSAYEAGLTIDGFEMPRAYGRQAQPELLEYVRRFCRQIHKPQPGAYVVFRFDGEALPRHFGILTENGNVIHCDGVGRKQVVEHGYRAQFVRWTHSLWLHPALEEMA